MNSTVFYRDVEELRKSPTGSGVTTNAIMGKWAGERFPFHEIDREFLPDNFMMTPHENVYVDFRNAFANERTVPEFGWSMFITMEEGCIATFKDGEPVFGVFYAERGEDWMAGMWIAPATGLVATNRTDENAPCKETMKWVPRTPEHELVMIAMDFLYGFSCRAETR